MHTPRPNLSLVIDQSGSTAFDDGRHLAKAMYRKMWNTRSMSDDYDLCIVAYAGSQPAGNMNLQLRRHRDHLPSEHYFNVRHWLEFRQAHDHEVGEICGLAISDATTPRTRRIILGGLILGIQLAAMHARLSVVATIQRARLINRAITAYKYPFRRAQTATKNPAALPQDRYWQSGTGPGLYFVDARAPQTLNASTMLFSQLSDLKIGFINNLSERPASFLRFPHAA